MFEGYTLEKQRQDEIARGWKPDFSALTYCTAEAVVYRRPKNGGNVLNFEILVGKRSTTKGIEDMRGRPVGRWGTQVRTSSDPTSRDAVQRYLLKESFGWDIKPEQCILVDIVGPWLHKATVHLDESRVYGGLILKVHEGQGEVTPFESKLFRVDATGLEIDPAGKHTGAFDDVRWTSLRDLIAEQGENPDFLYWLMVALSFHSIWGSGVPKLAYYKPGDYEFQIAGRPTWE